MRDLIRPADAGEAALVRSGAGDIDAVEADFPGVGVEIAGDQIEKRGLAGAVGADDADGLAARDGEIDGIGGLDGAEGSGEAPDLEEHC